jgi:hypothetical protein
MKRPPLLLLILSVIVSASDTVPLASIHLKLAKDTLALAEPVLLTVEVNNNSGNDLLLDNCAMFTLEQNSYRFSLTLIAPDGQEWPYDPFSKIDVLYAASAKLYFFLPPGESASDIMLLWWTCFLPDDYQVALEKLPPGTYKLFATYRLPKQKESEVSILYSDTFEFVFLPVQKEYIPVLIEMDSLYFYLNGGLKRGLRDEAYQRITRIKDSHSPYSEAAHVKLAYTFGSIDDLRVEKERFNRLYPNSAFEPFLVKRQFIRARSKGLSNEMDSLLGVCGNLTPTDHIVLKEQNKIRLVTAEEASDK